MNNEELILNNILLIYKCIRDLNIYWENEEEYQDYYYAGLEGLIISAKKYKETSKTKFSTFAYTCIRNNIITFIIKKEALFRKIDNQKKISLDQEIINNKSGRKKTLYEMISDKRVNIEKELEIEELVNSIKNIKDKEILCYYYGINKHERLDINELQNKYKISRQAINMRLKRARENIKEYLLKNY